MAHLSMLDKNVVTVVGLPNMLVAFMIILITMPTWTKIISECDCVVSAGMPLVLVYLFASNISIIMLTMDNLPLCTVTIILTMIVGLLLDDMIDHLKERTLVYPDIKIFDTADFDASASEEPDLVDVDTYAPASDHDSVWSNMSNAPSWDVIHDDPDQDAWING